MTADTIAIERDARGVVRLAMNRPERHNAFDEALIERLVAAFEELAADPGVRALVLTGNGRSFSAGADLAWMRRASTYDAEANRADAARLAHLMRVLDELPCPTIARVNGAAIGGGVGLVACCDMAVAADRAVFALSEVRLGIVPAVIAPFVRRAIGEHALRRYALTAERFDAAQAAAIGLVQEVVDEAGLDAAVDGLLDNILAGGREAQARIKQLMFELRGADREEETRCSIEAIAERRASAEGREGIAAFLAHRKPSWRSD